MQILPVDLSRRAGPSTGGALLEGYYARSLHIRRV